MAIIGKVATGWTGTSGGPGLTQLYVEKTSSLALTAADAQIAVNAVRAFWDAIKGNAPDEIVWVVQPTVDMYDPANGTLVDTITATTAPVGVQGGSAAVYSMAAGIKVNLQTNEIRNGRRVRGSIYIVPASSVAMTSTGNVGSSIRTAINTAGNAMIAALVAGNMNLIVWGRPLKDPVTQAVTRAGTVNYVQAVDTGEKSAILRGRRD